MELIQLNEAIDRWASKKMKDICDVEDLQLLLIADVGQLAQAIWEEDVYEQQEKIGILYISLRMIMLQQGGMFEDTELYRYQILGSKPIRKTYMIENLCRQLGDVFDGDDFNEALQHVAQYLEFDFVTCIQVAYDAIKDANITPLDDEMLCCNKD